MPRPLVPALFGLLLLSGCAPNLAHVASPAPVPTVAPSPTPVVVVVAHTPQVVEHGPRTGDSVALTFDADLTVDMLARLTTGRARSFANTKVLDILEQRGVPATFFLTGMWVKQYPEVTTRLAANPDFELANHTWSHGAFTARCYGLTPVPRARMAEEVRRTFDIIEPFGGRQTRYFRFPGLCYDAVALTELTPLDVTVIQGDVISGDPGAWAWRPIVDAVLTTVQPGSIVILHITEDNATMTDEALPHILDGLTAKGLHPVRLSQLLAPRT